MKYIKIDNYSCDNCGNKEYDVIFNDSGNVELIICSECGSIYTGEYEEIEEV